MFTVESFIGRDEEESLITHWLPPII